MVRASLRFKEQFQSTLPRGERHPKAAVSVVAFQFQSTLPRGERRTEIVFVTLIAGFNPRSHVGSDICCFM